MLVKEAHQLGKVSLGNTKMPGSTFAQDAFQCGVGSKLREVPGSICSQCNMIRIQKMRPSVDKGYKLNQSKWENCNPQDWIDSMVFQIVRLYLRTLQPYHRWFDSGDLADYEQLMSIDMVARLTPQINHWLPTKEYSLVKKYFLLNIPPKNLVIRPSAPMIDGKPSKHYQNTSTVHKNKAPQGFPCQARSRGNHCGECRACWDGNVANVSYPKH
jgi:hypothetical protein